MENAENVERVERESKTADSHQAPRTRSPLWKKLALAATAGLLAGLISECLLVLIGVSFPLLYQPDPYCGSKLRPNLNVRYIEEGRAIVSTNSHGFRDFEHPLKKPDRVFRIAIIGDSFCEAIQVDVKKTFWHLLESKLSSEDDFAVEVLNFGTSGFGTAQEYQLLKNYAARFKPDLVVLAIFTGNDIGDNSADINTGQIKPYYRYVDGQLTLDQSFRSNPSFVAASNWTTQTKVQLINSSRSLQLANKFYAGWKNRRKTRVRKDIGLDPNVYLPPSADSAWEDAWQVTEGLIRLFQDKCRDLNSKLLVLTLSNPIQVHPDPSKRIAFAKEHAIENLFYPDRRLEEYCQTQGIVSLKLAESFWETVRSAPEPLFLHGFRNTEMGTGHWNENGHRKAFEELYDFLKSKKGRELLPVGPEKR